MKQVAVALCCSLPLLCLAAKPCEELKSEIDAKLAAAKVQGYALSIVASADAGDGKVVGSCEGGSKKILYARGAPAAKAAPAEAAPAKK